MVEDMIARIKIKYDDLRKSEKKVAKYIVNFRGDFNELTTAGVAKSVGVSEPTVVRFTHAVGIESFKSLKRGLIEERIRTQYSRIERCDVFGGYTLSAIDTLEGIPDIVINANGTHLENSLKNIDIKTLHEVIEMIKGARQILICGIESSTTTVFDLNVKLKYLGYNCSYQDDQYLKYMSACNLTSEDIAIGVSYSGQSKETIDVLKLARLNGARTIGITNFSEGEIEEVSDVLFSISGENNLYGNKVFSRGVQLAIVDMIYMGVILTDFDYYTKKIDCTCELIKHVVYEGKNRCLGY